MMRHLGIDFGTKKIGIALSDESGTMAFPREVVPNDSNLLSYIEKLVEAERVKEIVIGHSIDKAGNENPVHKEVKEFITNLTLAVGIPIHLEPEQYTSAAAARVTGKNDQTDAAAAALILESYLRKQRKDSVFEELNN